MSPRVLALPVVHREQEGSPYPKCSLWLRAGARAFDIAVAFGLTVIGGSAGPVVALLFLSLADGLLQGQSVGKRLFGVKAMYVPGRRAAGYRESVLRNAPFALVVLLGMMPSPLGSVAFLGGALVIGGVEAWKVIRDPLGLRLGDVWAQTQVVDGKVVVGGQVLASASGAAAARAAHRAADRNLFAARSRRADSDFSKFRKSRRVSRCASR